MYGKMLGVETAEKIPPSERYPHHVRENNASSAYPQMRQSRGLLHHIRETRVDTAVIENQVAHLAHLKILLDVQRYCY